MSNGKQFFSEHSERIHRNSIPWPRRDWRQEKVVCLNNHPSTQESVIQHTPIMDIELGQIGGRGRSGSLEQSKPSPEGANNPIKVVVAVDASSGAQSAFVRAVELMQKNLNPNSLLYVLATRALPTRWGTVLEQAQQSEDRREEDKLRQLLGVYEQQLQPFEVPSTPQKIKSLGLTCEFNPSQFRYRLGISRGDDVGPAIVKRVEELRADLLVMSRRDTGRLIKYTQATNLGYCYFVQFYIYLSLGPLQAAQ